MNMEKIPLIYDCDNTMGLVGADVDDGLTLLYLLAQPDIELLGVTLTHGNGSLKQVIAATESLVNDLGLTDLPVYSGPQAARFMIETTEQYAGDLCLLATGTMTNLQAAADREPAFYSRLRRLYLMGGVTRPLELNGHSVKELNFSVDPAAALNVLRAPVETILINGHTASQALFGVEELAKLRREEGPLFQYISSKIQPWVDRIYNKFQIEGFCNWDMAAALIITRPELFSDERVMIDPTLDSVLSGDIAVAKQGKTITMPSTITDIEQFNTLIFEAFDCLQAQLVEKAVFE